MSNHEYQSSYMQPADLAQQPQHNPSPVINKKTVKRCALRIIVSNLLYNVNTYKSPNWSWSPSDVTLRQDSALGVYKAL